MKVGVGGGSSILYWLCVFLFALVKVGECLPCSHAGGCVLQDCINAYNKEVTEQPSTICESIARAELCINDCGLSTAYFNFERQLNQDRAKHCSGMPTTQPPCNVELPNFNDSLDIMELEDPIISYKEDSDPHCFQNSSTDKEHCSMFTYSHIHQFSHNTIQTCSVGMLQALIDLSNKLSILVTAVADGQSPQYTNLQEVR